MMHSMFSYDYFWVDHVTGAMVDIVPLYVQIAARGRLKIQNISEKLNRQLGFCDGNICIIWPLTGLGINLAWYVLVQICIYLL